MRKTINILALVFFVWLVLNTFHVSDIVINFILVGALPGSTTASVSPSMMLALMTTCVGFIIFELLARRFGVFRQIRYHFINFTKKRDRLPKRRFSRV